MFKSNHNFLSPSHSYLGNGLYAARLATLGALGADGRVQPVYCPSLCHESIFCPGRCQTFLLFWLPPGLDWKVFTSSCLPKKFREDVTFGGTTYQVSGIPDGKIIALWGFGCLPSALEPVAINSFNQLWNTIKYSIMQFHTRTLIRCSCFNCGA